LPEFLHRGGEERSGRGKQSKESSMAGGGVSALGVKKERAAEYKGRMTWAVAMACLVAAVGGSIFGYDIGISGNLSILVLCLRSPPFCFTRRASMPMSALFVWLLLCQPWSRNHRKSLLSSIMNIRTCHMHVSSGGPSKSGGQDLELVPAVCRWSLAYVAT
jgi:hypothetical protein